jgi:hypothetical protein
MIAYSKDDTRRGPSAWTAAYLLLLFILLFAFIATIDGAPVKLGSNSGYGVYKLPTVVGWEHNARLGPFWIGIFPEDYPPIHSTFLLFDFKQNLRRWPNVAGDISRSPPLFLPL